ncbi:hypothetical protein [Winogradskyella schleiferi]|uniref:hypothetical protein n=1 Tax=Winogradskyella schleiferi TaxID=2686078 RepID=UPI0015BC2222|nr:hypothetical protein [Winogradskyella schleiferi]
MFQRYKYKSAVFFTIVLMALISAPTIIVSFDDTSDVTCFYSITEEEENQHVKLVFEHNNLDSNGFFEDEVNASLIGYTFKQYPKPHLNLISPPPDFI